ncbi:MAG: uroporphyrinogen-III synthase [Marinilabiliales bacterium]|nr:MAG: uroporphyrinogen-III synthase [Marinilabiliales bacterium]
MKIKNILVSQPKPADLEKSPYGELCKKYNLKIDFHKFIKVEEVSAQEFRQAKGTFQGHTAVILTSRHAVDHFFRIAKELRYEIPDSTKYFCISESTAYYLQKYVQYRKRKIFHGKQNFEDLIEVLKKHTDEKFLVPSSDIHKQTMFQLLDKEKINYNKAVIYRTVASNLKNLDIESYDIITFFSPAGVKSLYKNFPKYEQNNSLIAAFGPTTAKAVKEAGLKLNIPAPTKSAPSMTMAIEEYLTNLAKENRRNGRK